MDGPRAGRSRATPARGARGRDARGEDTRAALLAAGRRVFARKGFDGASVRDITREAGTNLGAITYHFGSKRALYEAVLTAGISPLVERVAAAAGSPAPPVERLEGVIDVFFDYIEANPDLPRLLLQEVSAGKQPPRVVVGLVQQNARNVGRILSDGWEDGTLRRGHPILMAISVVSQPLFMSLMAPLVREAGGVDLADPATRRAAAEHVKSFVRTGLTVRREISE